MSWPPFTVNEQGIVRQSPVINPALSQSGWEAIASADRLIMERWLLAQVSFQRFRELFGDEPSGWQLAVEVARRVLGLP